MPGESNFLDHFIQKQLLKKTLVNEEKDTMVDWSSGVVPPNVSTSNFLNTAVARNILGESVKFELDTNVPNNLDGASETTRPFSETNHESINIKDVPPAPGVSGHPSQITAGKCQ